MHKDNSVRIISGLYRSRILTIPSLSITRPSKDRVREALFSPLINLENKTFLDLYAGSGAVGIESISRGASLCVFNDLSREAYKCIKNNLKTLEIPQNKYFLFNLDDLSALRACEENNLSFDYIYLDPPYIFNNDNFEKILNKIVKKYLKNYLLYQKYLNKLNFALSEKLKYNFNPK